MPLINDRKKGLTLSEFGKSKGSFLRDWPLLPFDDETTPTPQEEIESLTEQLAEANSKIELLTRAVEMIADEVDFDPYLVSGWSKHKKGRRRERFDRHRWS